jgi:nicotinate phosphoribosyltransferase
MHSLLDQDFYTYTVGQTVNWTYKSCPVVYKFTDRQDRIKYNPVGPLLQKEVAKWSKLRYETDELEFLRQYLHADYIKFLRDYQFNPNEVLIFNDEGYLGVQIRGEWGRTIFWEVPLLATISELFYKNIESKYETKFADEQWKAHVKMFKLNDIKAPFVEFGTRRRRSFDVQDAVLYGLVDKCFKTNLLGTSNVYFAKKYGFKPVGTMSHQWMMGICGIEGPDLGTTTAKNLWIRHNQQNPGFFLTDTYTTPHFLERLTPYEARLFDGLRQDSGDPIKIMNLVCDRYKELGIEPRRKQIMFSDSLTVAKVTEICEYINSSKKDYMRKKIEIEPVFGIGTHFTNDYPDALNIVIKLAKIHGRGEWLNCVKLSDNPGKHSGSRKTIKAIQSKLTGVLV